MLTIDEAWTHGELKATKTNRRRTVPVVAPLADDLALLAESIAAEPAALVAPGERGQHLHLGNWRSRVFATAAAADVQAAPYDGRHTFVTLLINEGRPPVLVAQQTGHSLEELWRSSQRAFRRARRPTPRRPKAR